MSNKRIDHVAEALAHLDDAEAYANDAHSCRVNGNDERSAQALSHASISAQQAQVHATLALVEQQRIANVLALGQYTTAPGDMPVYRSVIFHGDGIRPDITAALGLETRND